MELDADKYDVVVLGTGLAESIAAAALAKNGKSVLHLDPNGYYGSRAASLTLDELISWSSSPSDPSSSSSTSTYAMSQSALYTNRTTSPLPPSLGPLVRRYALSLFPSVLPSRGPLISTLIASDVSKYVSFRMLDTVGIASVGPNGGGVAGGSDTGTVPLKVDRVPGSKEEVFKDKSIGLMEKRRLMKFLMFAAGEFESDPILKSNESTPLPIFLAQAFQLPPSLVESITFGIAHCSTAADPTLPALLRTRRYLKSLGRYGPSAFLVGQYGGAGEVAQGFCRACAVHGGTYVLGPTADPESIEYDVSTHTTTLKIPCHPRPVTAGYLITSSEHLPDSQLQNAPGEEDAVTVTAHCIAILSSLPESLEKALHLPEHEPGLEPEGGSHEDKEEKDDTAVVIFPPRQGEDSLVRALVMGEGTGSCPQGQYILYLSATTSASTAPETLLAPYLTAVAQSSSPLFTAYYLSHRSSPAPPSDSSPSVSPSLSSPPRTRKASTVSTSTSSPGIVRLYPYAGEEVLTEGLDWEAEQGEAAFWAVSGRNGGKGFFEKDDEEGEGDDEDE